MVENLINVSFSSGRIISPGTMEPLKKRGVNTHNIFSMILVNIFGSGTTKVDVNNKSFYLNNKSCFKLIAKSTNPDLTFKSFSKMSTHEKIEELQKAFDFKTPQEKSVESIINKASLSKEPSVNQTKENDFDNYLKNLIANTDVISNADMLLVEFEILKDKIEINLEQGYNTDYRVAVGYFEISVLNKLNWRIHIHMDWQLKTFETLNSSRKQESAKLVKLYLESQFRDRIENIGLSNESISIKWKDGLI